MRARAAPKSLLSTLSSEPTSTAAMTVPTPTLPRVCSTRRQAMSDTTIIEMSKASLTVENFFLESWEMASIAPSPASGMKSAGTYRKMPKATNTVLTSIMTICAHTSVGVGMKARTLTEKVVNAPKSTPTGTWSRFFTWKARRSSAICRMTSATWNTMVERPRSRPAMQVMV